jgi:dihydroorotate dehydrogenase (fumarate)
MSIDLSTTYMGLTLKHPIVPSASPLSRNLNGIRQLEDAGASAVVMYSLFEEQITLEGLALDTTLNHGSEAFPEALSYFPDLEHYNIGPDQYLELISDAKTAVNIPIIGSLNGVTTGGWIEYARHIEQAGANALELNLYNVPADPNLSSIDVEERYLDVLREVRANVQIPIAVKISPFFSAPANMAMRFATAGADALVMFNRFYQPDFDLEKLEAVPALQLSNSHELRMPLRWVAIMFGRVPLDLAITSGVHTHEDVLKGLMAGARVTMMASELLEHGVRRIKKILGELENWLELHEYESLRQLQGSMSEQHLTDPSAFERANYLKVLDSWRPTMRREKVLT